MTVAPANSSLLLPPARWPRLHLCCQVHVSLLMGCMRPRHPRPVPGSLPSWARAPPAGLTAVPSPTGKSGCLGRGPREHRKRFTVPFFFQIDEPVHLKNDMNLKRILNGLTASSVGDQVTPISDAAGLASPSQLPDSETAARDAVRRPKPGRELRVTFACEGALFLSPFSLTIEYCKNRSWLTGSGGIWPAGQVADPSQARTLTRPNLNFS